MKIVKEAVDKKPTASFSVTTLFKTMKHFEFLQKLIFKQHEKVHGISVELSYVKEIKIMKRWIHASRDIEYKVKDYIAAWAKDDVKEGNPMAGFREFKEEMRSEGLKADEDSYDYYVACYNNACGSSEKKVNASSKVGLSKSDSKAVAENTSIDSRKFSDID